MCWWISVRYWEGAAVGRYWEGAAGGRYWVGAAGGRPGRRGRWGFKYCAWAKDITKQE